MIKTFTGARLKYETEAGSGAFTNEIQLQFSPTDLTDSYTADFTPSTDNKNHNLYFRQATRGDLTLNLTLDGTEPIEQTGGLAKLSDRLRELRGLTRPVVVKKKRKFPARVQFIWGDFVFEGYATSLTEKQSLFSSDGELLRVDVTLVLKAVYDPELIKENNSKDNSRKFHTVMAGDRLDLLAEKYFGDARLWRPIAEENEVERPAAFPGSLLGATLYIPDLSPRELARREARRRNR